MDNQVNDPLITRREFCQQGKFGIKTLQRIEARGDGPPAIEITPGLLSGIGNLQSTHGLRPECEPAPDRLGKCRVRQRKQGGVSGGRCDDQTKTHIAQSVGPVAAAGIANGSDKWEWRRSKTIRALDHARLCSCRP